MLKILVAFVSGILLDAWIPLPIWILFLTWIIFVAGFLGSEKSRTFCLVVMILFSGSTFHAIQTRPTHPHDLRHIKTGEGLYVALEGRLLETPRQRKSMQKEGVWESSQARLQTFWISHGEQRLPVHGEVLVRTHGSVSPLFHKGQSIIITGVLSQAPAATAKGLFDYKKYLSHQGIHRILTADSTESWQLDHKITEQPGRPWTDRFQAWAMRTMNQGLPEVDDATKLQWAMVLGWKTWLHDEMIEPFRWSGSMHLFAISGLHVAIVSGLILGGLRVCQLPMLMSGLLTIPCVWGYIAISGWQTSAIRAGIMMSILIGGWMLRRPHSMVNSLFSAAWIILLWQPNQIFQTGFQLSFGVALSLITLVNPIRDRLMQWTQPDPWIIKEHLSLVQKIQAWIMRKLVTPVAVSLAAWLGSLPIIWQQFHLIAPIGLAGNLVLIPMAGFTISCAMGSMLCNPWAPEVSELFNHSGWFWMTCMKSISSWMANLAGSHFHVPSIPNSFLWCHFAVLLLMALRVGNQKWYPRLKVAGICSMILLLASHIYQSYRAEDITFIPIPRSDSIWMNQPGLENDFLIDGGHQFAMERSTIPFLRSRGVNTLNSIWMTHGDADHIGGLSEIIDQLKPKRVSSFPHNYKSPYYKEMIQSSEKRGIIIGSKYADQSESKPQVLYPPQNGDFQTADDANLVLAHTMADHRILMIGDLSREGIIQLGNMYPDLQADILVLNRPKLDTTPNIHWIDLLNPKLILVTGIQAGIKDHWMMHLKTAAFNSKPVIWDTGEKGSVEIANMQDRLKIQPHMGTSLIFNR